MIYNNGQWADYVPHRRTLWVMAAMSEHRHHLLLSKLRVRRYPARCTTIRVMVTQSAILPTGMVRAVGWGWYGGRRWWW